jgi:hypothetical protein
LPLLLSPRHFAKYIEEDLTADDLEDLYTKVGCVQGRAKDVWGLSCVFQSRAEANLCRSAGICVLQGRRKLCFEPS